MRVESPAALTGSSIYQTTTSASSAVKMRPVKLYSIDDHEKGYVLESSAGQYHDIVWSDGQQKDGVCGFGQRRVIGLRHKSEIFVAIYVRDGRLHVALPSQSFVWPGSFTAHRKSWLSRVKSFEIRSGSTRHIRFFYTFIDSQHEFPGPEAMDIFYMIAWKTSNRTIVDETIRLWQNMPGAN